MSSKKGCTSAAAAARARASSAAVEPDPGVLLPPSVRGGPPTFRGALAAAGTEAEVGAGGVLPRGRPGCEKGSRSLLQRLPIFVFMEGGVFVDRGMDLGWLRWTV